MTYNYNKFALALPTKSEDPTGLYKRALVNKINKYPHLTMAGIDAPFTTPSGMKIPSVEYAGPNSAITFGSAKYHDINYYDDYRKAVLAGIPTLKVKDNWADTMKLIENYAKRTAPTKKTNDAFVTAGFTIREFDNFFIIGDTVIPKYPRKKELVAASVEIEEAPNMISIEIKKYFA